MSIRRPPAGYVITGAAREEVPALIAIDVAAGKVFEGTGLLPEAQLGDHVPAKVLEAAIGAAHLHVARTAKGALAGFAMTSVREGWLYLDQISVDPAHGRGGVGSALIGRVMLEARDRGLKRVTLSTFRDPPWNGPFYRRNGFRELPRKKMEKWMIEIESVQDDLGLNVRDRCFMARRLRWL